MSSFTPVSPVNVKAWFPTLICDFESQTHDQFKTVFYNNMPKYVHPDGLDGEHADLFFHHNTELEFFFKEITHFAKQYLIAMEIDPEEWDINLVKCWWQSLKNNNIPMHNHSDAHLSFVYYANVPPESGNLIFQTDTNYVNDLTNGFFLDDYEKRLPFKRYNMFNSMSVAYEAKEGMVVVFPARLDHMTTPMRADTADIQTTDVDVIKKRRISIAGDFLLTFKKPKHTAMGLQPINCWRNFG
jgi:hypothetical protein